MVVCDRLKMTHFILSVASPTSDSTNQRLMKSAFCINGFPREFLNLHLSFGQIL